MFGRCHRLADRCRVGRVVLAAPPHRRYGATNFGAISRTLWPKAANCRAQWCAPEHASMPIVHGGRVATNSSSFARGTAGRLSSGLPASLTPCTRKHVLGEIDTNGQNSHGLPLPNESMRFATPIVAPLCRSPQLAAEYSGWGSPFHSLGVKFDPGKPFQVCKRLDTRQNLRFWRSGILMS